VEYFLKGKQKVILFPIFKENGWEAARNALSSNLCHESPS
jgi:hypothetical protein